MTDQDEIERILALLTGKKCFQTTAGGGAGSIIALDIGRKLKASTPRKKGMPQRYWGEWAFMIWCGWRLDDSRLDEPITSSAEPSDIIAERLTVLVGDTVSSVTVHSPAWDLTLGFESGRELCVFCDLTLTSEGDEEFVNWWLWTPDEGKVLRIGPGYRWRYTASPYDEPIP